MQANVTDEMIARYLSGKSTSDEEAAVLDYMSENDEHLEELLAMAAAVEQFGDQKTEHKSRIRPLWSALSAAASVALLIGVGFALWHNSHSGAFVGIDPAPAYGEQVSINPAPTHAEQDSILEMNDEEKL